MRGLRNKLSGGAVAYGCFSLLAEPIWVELIGNAGFDFVVADCEEAGGDSYGAGVDNMVRAADATGLGSCVRVVENAPGAINRALNAGADGIFVPHVRSADEAYQAAQSTRYAPSGRRGAAPSVRAAGYGAEDWSSYYRRANDDSLLFIMVEDTEGVHNIEEIVKVPGVDGVMVGTWDLAVELGCATYGPTPPQVMEHVDHVIKVTTESGLFMGAHAWSAELIGKYVDRGCQLLFASLDSNLLLAGLREFKAVADEIEAR